MPGLRSTNLRQGDHGERLAEFILGSFAFTTNVPRPEDIGHDFHCVLAERAGSAKFLLMGPSFNVQVKSDHQPLRFDHEHEIDWIVKQENPFFLCVMTRETLTCEVYSTWNRVNGFLLYGPKPTLLQPGGEFALPFETDGVLHIPLGPPVVRLTAQDATDAKVGWVAEVLRPWIQLDRLNIVNAEVGLHWAEGPLNWKTNEAPPSNDLKRFYWNAKNLKDCIDNFGRTAIALRNTIERFSTETGNSQFDAGIADIDKAFDRFAKYMDDSLVDFHRASLGRANPPVELPNP